MSSRESILSAIRKNLPEPSERPELDRSLCVVYEDIRAQFTEVLKSVGGRAVFVKSHDEIVADLPTIPAFANGKKVLSNVEGIDVSSFGIETVTDPHTLEDVDFAILQGQFGVAENGAVYMTFDTTALRVSLFLTQHLALVIPASSLVNNLHEAYDRIDFDTGNFSAFVSGPSKTADIEQSLVIGAHGARSLNVYLLES